MKRILIAFLVLSILTGFGFNVNGQGVSIGAEGVDPHASAILDVVSAEKGILIPRIELTGTDDNTTIMSPAVSLLIFNTATAGEEPFNVSPGFYYWDGNLWVSLATFPITETDPTWEGEANQTDPVSRTGQVAIGTVSPEPNAMLEVESGDKGFLPPRLNLVQTTNASPLSNHIAGMVVYNLQTENDVVPGLYVNDGTKWVPLLPVIYTAGEGIEIINNQISVTGGGGGGDWDPTLIYTTSGF